MTTITEMTDTEALAGIVRGYAYDRVRRFGIKIDYDALEQNVYTVAKTKRLGGLTYRELAQVAIERTLGTARRLAHDTGAVNWL